MSILKVEIMSKYLFFVLAYVSVFVCTPISAQHKNDSEKNLPVTRISNGGDSVLFNSPRFYDGKDAQYYPDSLFHDNGDGTRTLILEGKQLEDFIKKIPSINKDAEGNIVNKEGKTINSLIIKSEVWTDSIIIGGRKEREEK